MLLETVYASRHQVNFGGYFGPFSGIGGALEVSWQDKYFGPAFYYGIRRQPYKALDDFAYLNLRLDYTPRFKAFGSQDPLRLSLYLKNLLDERPEESLMGLNSRAPGREVFFGMELQF